MKTTWTFPWRSDSAAELRRGCSSIGPTDSAATFPTGSIVLKVTIPLVLIGSAMQAYANSTIDALLVALMLLLVGTVAINLVFPRKKPEMRAFLLTYGICVFAGGLAQVYSLAVFNNPQSTIDSFTFFRMISPRPPFAIMADVLLDDSPLAIIMWQHAYKLTWKLGFEFGPYTGVMFNALAMGLTAGLTVRTARELYGNDPWRLRRVGSLFAFCGLFILFGAVLLRDCFVMFFVALVLWGLVRCLVRMTLPNLLFASGLLGISAFAMFYLRIEVAVLFGLDAFLAFFVWLLQKRLDAVRLTIVLIAAGGILISGPYISDYVQKVQETQIIGMRTYDDVTARDSLSNSLGMNLVVNQPLPIRLIMGTGALMVNPIPLWANFNIRSVDYQWIKGYNGLYQVLALPLVFMGFIAVYRLLQRNRKRGVLFLFLVMYLLMSLAAVVATSLEQRHFAAFMPALMILAALPDTREMKARKEWRMITICWFTVVVLIHLTWLIRKGLA